MHREDIDVEVTGESLTIRGERKFDEASKDKYVRVERPMDRSSGRSASACRCSPTRSRPRIGTACLRSSVPKAEEVKPKKIKINAE